MTENSNTNQSKELLFTEALASWSTRNVDPNGYECQITLRAVSSQELLEKVRGAIAYLMENDCILYTYRGGYRSNPSKVAKDDNSKGDGQSNIQSWCSIHQCKMKLWEREDRSLSCPRHSKATIMPEAWIHVQAQLERLRRKFPGALFAVRSSAMAEDSAQASFVGEFEMVLEIDSDDEVRETIDIVRRSRRSEWVKAYSQAKGIETALDLSIHPQVINL